MRPRHRSPGAGAAKSKAVAELLSRLCHDRLAAAVRFARRVVEAFRKRLHDAVRCSQCREEVELFEEVCPHCGAGSPVRVGRPVSLILGTLVCAFAALWFCTR